MTASQQLLLGEGPVAAAGAYQIQRSLRFNSADSAYLNRTPASAGNRKTWTLSMWVKRSALGSDQTLLGVNATTDYTQFKFSSSDTLRLYLDVDALNYAVEVPTVVWRDPSAWYHIVLAMDTTQATSTNRVKIYVNGVQQTVSAISGYSVPAQNWDTDVNSTLPHAIGNFNYLNTQYLSGYITEVNFIDGQALDPTSFGEFNSDTGVWQPIAYAGTYGTNGFYLNFSDNSGTTSTTLGKDYSGNGNNWTPNNFSVTAGAGNDSMVDVPTNWGTDTGVGGEVRGNYCTLNPLDQAGSLSNGNLEISTTSASWTQARGTLGVSSGKWYWETTLVSGTNYMTGISKSTGGSTYPGANADGWGYASGTLYNNNSGSSYGASYTSGDVIGIALNLDAGTLTFYKNGTSQGQAASGLTGTWFPSVAVYASSGTTRWALNAGQRPFAYTPPAGFKSLCTTNLPEPTVLDGGDYMNTVLYTGNGTSDGNQQAITGVGFSPDLVWLKSRSNATGNYLADQVRGVNKTINSNNTNAEQTQTIFPAFGADGFTVEKQSANDGVNVNGYTYVAWNWKANGAGVTNTAGSITSTVSANPTAGFAIATTTGAGGAGTIGHGLGAVPQFIMCFRRNTSADHYCYHQAIGNTNFLVLNTTAASAASSNMWNNTTPTSTVFSVGNSNNNSGDTYVHYIFAPVAGYSAFGSYTGNGSTDGPFVFTNHRPRFLLVKCSSAAGEDWIIVDAVRNEYNYVNKFLYPNLSNAEGTAASNNVVDFLSNGFKVRSTSGAWNSSSTTYVYASFCENPFKYALAR